jgi:hypothetical protein
VGHTGEKRNSYRVLVGKPKQADDLEDLAVDIRMSLKYRVIQNDCRGVNNLSYTIHLR